MRQILDFVKTTVLGGAIFLLPFAAILLLVLKAGKMAVDTATPLAEKLPISKGEAVLAVYIGGTFLLVLVAFAAGLFARSFRIEKDAASFLEEKFLSKLPPYVAVRKYTDRLAGLETQTKEERQPVLVPMHNGWRLGFVADTFSDGHVAVFVPNAPDPSSGVVRIISADQITMLDISYQEALACLEQSGRGLPNLLAGLSFKQRTRSVDGETANEIVDLLKLEPNATCGFVRVTFVAKQTLAAGALPPPFERSGPLGSGLYFLVTPDAPVRLHRIRNDQLYHYYLGDPLELFLLHADGGAERVVVGPDLRGGQHVQLLIPGNTFHTARMLGRGRWFLGASTEWPGVVPADVEIGDLEQLAKKYPAVAGDLRSIAASAKDVKPSAPQPR